MQKQLSMRCRQEEPNGLQGMPTSKMSHGRNVQVRLSLRTSKQLVQNPLSHATIDTASKRRITARSNWEDPTLSWAVLIVHRSLTIVLIVAKSNVATTHMAKRSPSRVAHRKARTHRQKP